MDLIKFNCAFWPKLSICLNAYKTLKQFEFVTDIVWMAEWFVVLTLETPHMGRLDR